VATTLTKGVTTLTLPAGLLWTDEFAFETLAAESGYSVDGALIVDEAVKLGGRPMTLEGGEQHGWIDRATLLTLEAWRLLPGQDFTLSYRSVSYAVQMDHERGAVGVRAVVDYSNPASTDFYVLTLRLIQN
jgi:hypothetical protein